jgi:hypothetical protein
MIPVPLFDLTFPIERQTGGAREQRENKPLQGCQTRNSAEAQGYGYLSG